MVTPGNDFVFAPTHDAPISYRMRIRDCYQTLGYGAPYEWAHFGEVLFQALRKPLDACRLALIATAAGARDANAKFYKVYSGDSARDHDLLNTHAAVDPMRQ